jgi:hypothetical protein
MGATGGRWAQEVLFGSDGFELGSVAEATREATPRISFVLRFEGLCDVHIDATAEESAAGIWVGRVEPLAPLVARVRLADGRSAVEAGATISGACTALLRRPTDRTDLWRETVITVLVELDGWRDLSFSHPLGDPPPELTMERVEPK